MTSKQIKKLLPPEIKAFMKEQKELGGELEFNFDDFIQMDIRTIDGKKLIIAARYVEGDVLIHWYYMARTFYIKVNDVLISLNGSE